MLPLRHPYLRCLYITGLPRCQCSRPSRAEPITVGQFLPISICCCMPSYRLSITYAVPRPTYNPARRDGRRLFSCQRHVTLAAQAEAVSISSRQRPRNRRRESAGRACFVALSYGSHTTGPGPHARTTFTTGPQLYLSVSAADGTSPEPRRSCAVPDQRGATRWQAAATQAVRRPVMCTGVGWRTHRGGGTYCLRG